ncbi:permease prefix domain 1-containing protein [Terriglobus roseus]|uniref:MacB-like periplasmic core domain-containing protein n=1 Tax=Terriglobus roseus TaxID=392734 RepID=A0A1H4U8U1_9BACT|nr:permease prefix domain 1-containing protein [Terriglobus roseus]SEC65135.1 hypothetical protein SAMN05443244_3996 [Terriglobus roseus]
MIAAVRSFFARVCGLWSAPSHEAEMQEELQHDLALMIQDGEQRGLPNTEARRQALIQLGGLEQTMQAVRNRRTLPALEEAVQDIRFALRQLLRRPGFTLTAILTLTLGFGASLAIFAFVDAAVLRPLPYFEPQRLAWVTEEIRQMGPANLSWQDYLDWKQQSHSFQAFDVWRYAGYQIRSGSTLTPTPAIRVSSGFLSTLGVRPELG